MEELLPWTVGHGVGGVEGKGDLCGSEIARRGNLDV